MERPRTLCLEGSRHPRKSESLSPSSESETRKWPDELEKYDEISEYIKEVDEILDYIKPFPRNSESESIQSDSQKPGLDHLENLIRLVEQLKDLKGRNSQSKEKTQYLKVLRENKRKEYESNKQVFDFSMEEPLPPPPDTPKKGRSSIPFRKSVRSKSTTYGENFKLFSSENFLPPRKSLPQGKAKISKWTKVKEAFRWEKASQLDTKTKHSKSDKKVEVYRVQEPPIAEEIIINDVPQHGNLLQVPSEKMGDTPSPADSVLSGHISSCSSLGATSSSCHLASSGYSGEHSFLDMPAPPPRYTSQEDSLSLSLQELSYSSDEEKFDDILCLSEILARESSSGVQDDIEARRSKSLDGDTVLGPNYHLLQNLSKESLHDCAKSAKQYKTPWGKVKDIIHTRKGSIRKKSKKRDDIKDDMDDSSSNCEARLYDGTGDDSTKFMKPKIEVTVEQAPIYAAPITPIRSDCSVRPLTPVFTFTMPSTEELQNLAKIESETKKTNDEPVRICDSELPEDKAKCDPTSSARGSRWSKVKRAFLTSGNAEETGNTSGPSSPLHLGSFFSDIESDELSSGEWAEEKQCQDNQPEMHSALTTAMLKSEVQRNFNELQQNLCRELDAALDLSNSSKKNDKLKVEQGDKLVRKPRESLTIPLPTVDDLSPEFKKKLDEWKKIKKPPNMSATKDENQGHFISKIGEWPKWRTSASSSSKPDSQQLKQEHHLQEEFYKKLEEWQMLKGVKRRSRSHSDRGKDDSDVQSPSPGLSRKNSKRGAKKANTSGKSSGTESLSGSLKEKDGRSGRKSQKEKDLQWLEKELHKIEREKLRLEREKEKYLEREARLEQMKRTMGTTSPTQEVLIQTATGFFRFEGISQKFTKKLYEWEKARGIAPEASTFALLESASVSCNDDRGATLQRSKSVGSVIESASTMTQSIAKHPSSLSLNDVDDVLEQANLLDASRASSEPTLECLVKEDDEPEAIIVDVEDVVVETAALMFDQPSVQQEVPVYSYAPEEVTQLIDSSGSDGERETRLQVVQVKAEVQTEKATLIDQNINLLERLEVKEAIRREIENDLENEGRNGDDDDEDACIVTTREHFQREGETLEDSLLRHSEQQEEIAHHLVGNMRRIHAANTEKTSPEVSDVNDVLELSSQLLTLSHKLENALSERNADSKTVRTDNNMRRVRLNRTHGEKNWYSADEGTSCANEQPGDFNAFKASEDDIDVEGLPSLITKKVLELKTGLSNLKKVTEVAVSQNRNNSSTDHGSENMEASFTVRIAESIKNEPSTSSAETNRKRNTQRPQLKIISSESQPQNENLSPVTVTVSPPFWMKEKDTQEPRENRLEKSKAQTIFSDNSEETYMKNLKLTEKELAQEKKSPEVLKRKIKEKIMEMQRLSQESRPWNQRSPEVARKKYSGNSDEESPDISEEKNVVVVEKQRRGTRLKKQLKARRITDTTIAYRTTMEGSSTDRNEDEEELEDEVFVEPSAEDASTEVAPTPAYVFVPTTRKIISPVQRDTSSYVISYVIDDIDQDMKSKASEQSKIVQDDVPVINEAGPRRKSSQGKIEERKGSKSIDIGIPPLPHSPSTSKKFAVKEAAPSIRMMIAKYNLKMSGNKEDSTDHPSGTTSPVGWRSPVLDRRIKEQLEKFQKSGENALRHGGKFGRGEVQKSASAGFIRSVDGNQQVNDSSAANEEKYVDIHLRGILKSSSTGTMKITEARKECSAVKEKTQISMKNLIEGGKTEKRVTMDQRALRIKQAKAEFLSRGPGGHSWAGEMPSSPLSTKGVFSWNDGSYKKSEEIQDRKQNRLSHVSVGSESSFDDASYSEEIPNLIKSASAGMIHTCDDFSRRCSQTSTEPTCIQKVIGHGHHQIEPIPIQKSSSKFAFSNIKSRFRRVKMRKAKEKESAVSTLCRQSLLLDVSREAEPGHVQPTTSKSCPSSPVLERGKTKNDDGRKWMRYPATFFKS